MFVYDVSNLPRIVNINNLKLDSPKMQGGRNLLSIECLATTFRFIEGGTAPTKKKKRKKR
jgi:type IV pilus assembly protein PilO